MGHSPENCPLLKSLNEKRLSLNLVDITISNDGKINWEDEQRPLDIQETLLMLIKENEDLQHQLKSALSRVTKVEETLAKKMQEVQEVKSEPEFRNFVLKFAHTPIPNRGNTQGKGRK